jgi:hypothetical protein
MNEEQIRKIIEDTYDESKANTFHTMIKDFYNRKMQSVVIIVWTFALVCIAAAVVCGILFAKASDVKMMILYATLFLVCMHWIDLMKIFAWQFIHRNGIKREIKRLEIRIAELAESMKNN